MEWKTDEQSKEVSVRKFQKLIKNEFTFLIQDLKVEQTIELIYQNLLVGALVGQKEVLNAFENLYSASFPNNDSKSLQESKFFQWICSSQVNRFVLGLIERQCLDQQMYSVDLSQSSQMELNSYKSSQRESQQRDSQRKSNAGQTHLVKQQQAFQANLTETKPSKETQTTQPNIFEVIDLCGSQEQPINQSHPSENNQIMIYTDQQIREQINFQFEPNSKKEDSPKNQKQPLSFQQERLQNYENEIIQEGLVCNLPIIGYRDVLPLNEERVLQDSQSYGHFLFGDKIDRIVEIFYYQEMQYMTVRWRKRKDGTTLQDSTLPSATIKYHQPQQLIQFYQQLFWNAS